MKKIITLVAINCFLFLISNSQTPGACGKNNFPSPQNGSATLGMTYNNTACGLNYVHTDKLIETRFNQYTTAGNLGSGLPTTLSVSGLPANAIMDKAYAYYIVSYLTTVQSSSVVITNPNSVTTTIPSVNIGQDQSKCWGETGTVVYRADVTAAISGNGTYGITISGITGTSTNMPNWYDQIDGISLVIIYKDMAATYQGSMIIWDGDMTGVGNNYTHTMTGVNACGNSSYGNAFNIVSDMQDNVNANAHPCTLNGNTANYPNKMWNFDIANTIVASGQTTANFGVDGLGADCFAWGVMGLYYQTTNCTSCSPCSTSVANIDSVKNTSTCKSADGAIYISDSTTAGPLTYSWSNGATTQDISGLATGTYSVTITDTTGCYLILTVTIQQAASTLAVASDTIVPSSCSGNSGAISITVSGGNTPYTYLWSNGETTDDITGLAPGSYSLSVTDSSGCSLNFSTIVPNGTMNAVVTVNPVKCFGGNNGSATVTASGGTPPYTYLWSNAQTTQTAILLTAGIYTVQVTDAGGCTVVLNATVTGAPLLSNTVSSTPSSCPNCPDGSAQATTTGGTPPYTYLWNPNGQTSPTITGITPGSYTVCLVDANGCSKCDTITVGVVGINETDPNNYIFIYPNPSSGEFTIHNSHGNNYELKITNVLGETILEKRIGTKQQTINLDEKNGIYFIQIRTEKGTAVKKIIKQ